MRYLIKQAPTFIILGILTKIPLKFEKESTNISERKPYLPMISRNGLHIPKNPSYNGARFYHGTEKDFTQERIFSKFRETK